MAALDTSPEELRVAAALLTDSADRLGLLARRVGALESGTAEFWHGPASLGHRARMHSLRLVLHHHVAPLQELSQSAARAADRAQDARERVCSLGVRRREALRELDVLRGTPSDPADPGVAERARRIAELETVVGLLERETAQEESELDAVLDAVRGRVETLWPETLANDLQVLIQLAAGLGGAWTGLKRLSRGGLLLWTVERARWVDLSVRVALLERGQRLARMLDRAPWWARMVGRLGVWGIPLSIFPTAVRDLVTGGGYDGTRGAITRVGGFVAIPSSILLVAPVPSPHIKAVSAITLGSYGLWKAGNAVWDHREVVPPLAGAAWEEAQRRARELAEGLTPVTLGPLTPWAPELGGEILDWVRDRADDLTERVDGTSTSWRELLHEVFENNFDIRLDDLPDLPDPDVTWDDLIRDLGPGIGVPRIPIDTGPRLPVIPPWVEPFLPSPPVLAP